MTLIPGNDSEAILSWTGGIGTYNVEYKKATDTEWTSFLTNTTLTTTNLTSLQGGANYEARVQSVCDESDSGWNTIDFWNPCAPIAITLDAPYTQDFEDGVLPDCWDVYDPDGFTAPYVYNLYGSHSGSYSLWFKDAVSYAVLPEFNLPLNLLQISFWIHEAPCQLQLGYLTAENDGTCNTFTAIEDFNPPDGPWVECNKFLFGLPATVHRLAFKWSESDMACYIDDVVVSINPNAITTQTIALSAGWNWFSTYIEADDLLEQLEEALGENGISIESKDDGLTEYDGEDWFGGLDDVGITNEQMYLIETSTACTIQLNGTPANAAFHPITINPGWNWIGFPCTQEMNITDAFAGFDVEEGDQLEGKEGYTEFDGEDWFGEIETLTPGQGYLYFSNSAVPKTLIFQTNRKPRP